MAKKFKDYYDGDCANLIAKKIAGAYRPFPSEAFVAEIETAIRPEPGSGTKSNSSADPTFSQRQDIFAAALERALPPDYPEAVSILHSILGPPLEQAEGMFTYGWWLWPIGRYIERNALLDASTTIAFCYDLTQRFTAEFALRPLVRDRPVETLEVLTEWSRDPDVHVRRCASEVTRVSLPWASKLTVAIDHFDIFRPILDNLRDAPEKFVQKSVGNNLNDLMKADQEKAWTIIRDWERETPGPATQWIIRHGTRSLRKKAT